MNYDRDINVQDPSLGDILLVEDEKYAIRDRCPCNAQGGHVRWFLEGSEAVGSLEIAHEATLAKEWDDTGEVWWWFGRRISASDLRIGFERLPQWLRGHGAKAPERLAYAGKRYHLIGTTDASEESSSGEEADLVLWEYSDPDDIDNLLVEHSDEGEMTVYHGAYYDPADLRVVSP
jgi:hypothetical protein